MELLRNARLHVSLLLDENLREKKVHLASYKHFESLELSLIFYPYSVRSFLYKESTLPLESIEDVESTKVLIFRPTFKCSWRPGIPHVKRTLLPFATFYYLHYLRMLMAMEECDGKEQHEDEGKKGDSSDVGVRDVESAVNSLIDVKPSRRRRALLDVNAWLCNNAAQTLSGADIQSLMFALTSSLPHYIGEERATVVSIFHSIGNICKDDMIGFVRAFLAVAVKVSKPLLKSPRSGPATGASRLLHWSILVTSIGFDVFFGTTVTVEGKQLWNKMVEIQALLAHSAGFAYDKNSKTASKGVRSVSGMLVGLVNKHPASIEMYLAFLLSESGSIMYLTLLSAVIMTIPPSIASKVNDVTLRSQRIAFLKKSIANNKEDFTAHQSAAMRVAVSDLHHNEFESDILPAMQKAVLRSPTPSLGICLDIVSGLSLDVSKYALDLTKLATPQMKSASASLRSRSVALVACTSRATSHSGAVTDVSKHLLAVLGGSEGKLTAYEHRVAVMEALEAVAESKLSALSWESVAPSVVATLVAVARKEANSIAQPQAFISLAAWARHCSVPVPELISAAQVVISSSKKETERRGMLLALATGISCEAASATPPSLFAAVSAAFESRTVGADSKKSGNMSSSFPLELTLLLRVLLLLDVADLLSESSLSTLCGGQFWQIVATSSNAFSDLKAGGCILTQKALASATEAEYLIVVEVINLLYSRFESNMILKKSNSLTTVWHCAAIDALLVFDKWRVRREMRIVLESLLSSSVGLGHLLCDLLVVRVTSGDFSATENGSNNISVRGFSLQLVERAAMVLATPPIDADSKTRVAIASQWLVPSHRIDVSGRVWRAVMSQLKFGNTNTRVLLSVPGSAKELCTAVCTAIESDVELERNAGAAAAASLVRSDYGCCEVLEELVSSSLHWLSCAEFSVISQNDIYIYHTPEGELFDTSVIGDVRMEAEKLEEAAKNLRRSNKAYSYEDQKWELEMLAERARKAGNKPVKLLKQQEDAKAATLTVESAVRARVASIEKIVSRTFLLLRSVILANPKSFYRSGNVTRVAATLYGAPLSAPLVSERAVDICFMLRKCIMSRSVVMPRRPQPGLKMEILPSTSPDALAAKAAGLLPVELAEFVVAVALRVSDPYVEVPSHWTREALSVAVRSAIADIHFFAHSNADSTISPLGVAVISLILPLISAACDPATSSRYGSDTRIQAVELLLCVTGLVSDKAFPRQAVVSLLLRVASSDDAGLGSKATQTLWTYCTNFISYSDLELAELIDALIGVSSVTRLAAAKALLLPATPPMCSTLLCSHLLLLRHDKEDSSNQQVATKVWETLGCSLDEAVLKTVISYIVHPHSVVRDMASHATAFALTSFPTAISWMLPSLLELYERFYEIPPVKKDRLGNVISPPFEDPWQQRVGIANALRVCASAMDSDALSILFEFLVRYGLADRNEDSRTAFLAVGTTAVDTHGKMEVMVLLPPLEVYLTSPDAASEIGDRVRESVVVILGSLARHLEKTDPKVPPIVEKLIVALETPSQPVQEAVSKCLPPLITSVKADVPVIVERLMVSLLEGETFGVRKGAAYGLAGVVKGAGILSLKQQNIMTRLQGALQDKKQAQYREAALLALETLCLALGRLFEPYIIQVLPHLLVCFGDNNKDVRLATNEAARAIMSQLSGHGVKLVLPSLINALDDNAWRTKAGSVELLGAMAYCAPKQLSACLPQIVPHLIDVLTDSHLKVQEAGVDALNMIGSVIRNPEVQALVPALIAALSEPNTKTKPCLQSLLETSFIHVIDAPSLALIMPILQRALKERSTDIKKIAAQIVGNMCVLTDKKDLVAYIDSILPGLKAILLDPIPDVRGIAAKAFGSMVGGMGEDVFPGLLAWMLDTLKSDAGTVDRSGAAQGLSEVLSALGIERVTENFPSFIAGTSHKDPSVREGSLMLFVYLPSTLDDRFIPFVADTLEPILRGLADESEFVRATAMRAGQIMVSHYADTAVDLFLPALQKGLLDVNWRIRQSSVELLGDLLYKIGGVAAKKGTTSGGEDDNFGTESGHHAITDRLGVARTNEIMAGLYMTRQDVSPITRQSGVHVWKTIVVNTARTLRTILPVLVDLLLNCLASEITDQRQVSARTLGELVRKLGQRVLPDIVPMLGVALQSDKESTRQGVCIGLSEIMDHAHPDYFIMYMSDVVPAVRLALCDKSEKVRQAAATTFNHLHSLIGHKAVEEIIAPLLDLLSNEDESSLALDALQQVLSAKPGAILPYLVPRLIAPPITAANARALASLLTFASSDALTKYISSIFRALLDAKASGDATSEVDDALSSLTLSVNGPDGVHSFVTDVLVGLRSDNVDMRISTSAVLLVFCRKTHAHYDDHISQLMQPLIRLLADDNDEAVKNSWQTLNAITSKLKKEDLVQFVPMVRRNLKYIADSPVVKATGELPGFCLPKGLSPLLPMFLQGLVYGSPQLREECAGVLGDVILLTSAAALKPFVIQITGPLIRVVGDRFVWQVKLAILQTLSLLIERAGIMLKPFLPQLQTTFVKALSDPNRVIRSRASMNLTQLVALHTRIDPLAVELCNTLKNCADIGVTNTILQALYGVFDVAGKHINDVNKDTLIGTLRALLEHELEDTRQGAAFCLGSLASHISSASLTSLISDLTPTSTSSQWSVRHGLSLALSAILQEAYEAVDLIGSIDIIERAVLAHSSDDNMQVTEAAIYSLFYLLNHGKRTNGEDEPALSVAGPVLDKFVQFLESGTNDARCIALQQTKRLSVALPKATSNVEVLRVFCPPVIASVKSKVQRIKRNAERALIYLFQLPQGEVFNSYVDSLAGATGTNFIIDYKTRILTSHVAGIVNGSGVKDDDDIDNGPLDLFLK